MNCSIQDCHNKGVWVLGIRARLLADAHSELYPAKKPTHAAWAPNLPCYLCDQHVRLPMEMKFGLYVQPQRHVFSVMVGEDGKARRNDS